ncbi:23.6 kDa heat shock protein, mitochondrial-like [Rutidosis leptorrhynchoides]|uniref:23.6 kDa heat shock protein, mitochondrial-like n=1 Tax=Rutidosis leptorrhynchoides TaxID=125765 RepID=UPI003A99B9F5
MASSRVLKHLVTKSVIRFRPASSVATSYRFLNSEAIRRNCHRISDVVYRRDLAAKPSFFADVCNRFSTTRKLCRITKRLFETTKSTSKWIEPTITKEDDEGLYVSIHVSNVNVEDVKVSVSDNTVFIQGKDFDQFIMYMCWVDLPDIDSPDKIYNRRDIKAEMCTDKGTLKLIVPKFKKDEMAYNINVQEFKKKPSLVGGHMD